MSTIPTPTSAPVMPAPSMMPGLPPMPAPPGMAVPSAPAVAPAPEVPPAPPVASAPAPEPVPAPPPVVAAPAPEPVPAPPPAVMAAQQLPEQAAPAQLPVAAQATQAPVQFDASGWPVGADMSAVFETMGFEGVSFDTYGIVPVIRLDKTEFLKDDQVMPDQFRVTIASSRNKWMFAYGSRDDRSGASGILYTYDKVNDANGDMTVEQFMQEAAQAGQPVREIRYYEIDATLIDTGEAVKLSVPVKGSGSAFARFLTQCGAARRRPQEAVVMVKRGEKVTKVANPFYPWAFEIVGWLDRR